MRKAGSLAQEPPQEALAENEQPAQTTIGSISNAAPADAATITCALCNARFALTPGCEDDWKANSQGLEAAFMGICHFCFRCRRAACPECWDPVHRVCAQCVSWAGLSFRTDPSPLAHLTFLPLSSERQSQAESIAPFVCVRHGCYQSAKISGSNLEADQPQETAEALTSQKATLELPGGNKGRAVQLSQPVLPDAPAPAKKAVQMIKQPEDEPEREQRKSALKIIERALTIIALTVLLAVIALIVLAEVSTRANSEIVRLLHVDISSEVAYIIVLIKQIHW